MVGVGEVVRNLERGSESDSWMCKWHWEEIEEKIVDALGVFVKERTHFERNQMKQEDVMADLTRKLKKSKARLNQAKVMIEQLQEKVVKLEAQLAAKPAPKVVAPKVAPVAKKVVKKVAAKKVAKKVVKL